MKKLTIIAPIVQVSWIYLLIIALFTSINLDSAPSEGLFTILMLTIFIVSIGINIVMIVSAIIEKKEYKKLAFIDMALKIIYIPFYILVFMLALGFTGMLLVLGPGVLFTPIVIFLFALFDFIHLCTTSAYGSKAIYIAKRNGLLSNKASIIINICHYIFVIDVIASIVLYCMLRKKNDTPEDVKFRKRAGIASIVLIIIIILIMIISGIINLFHKPPNELYSKNPYTQNQIETYMNSRFANAKDVHFTSGTIQSKDEHNKPIKEWNIVVNDVNCHVASIPTKVTEGVRTRTYYRAETDYDYYSLKKYISENYRYSSWEMDSTYSSRYTENIVLINYRTDIGKYSTYELKTIENEIREILSVQNELLIQKEIRFVFQRNFYSFYITSDTIDQLYVDG